MARDALVAFCSCSTPLPLRAGCRSLTYMLVLQAKIARELVRVHSPATTTGSTLKADAVHLMVSTAAMARAALSTVQ